MISEQVAEATIGGRLDAGRQRAGHRVPEGLADQAGAALEAVDAPGAIVDADPAAYRRAAELLALVRPK